MSMRRNGKVKGRPVRFVSCLAACAWLASAGCGNDGTARLSLYQRLQSQRRDVRVAAIVQAGQQRDRRAVPFLVDRLEEDSTDVRMFTIESLRRITGRDFGFRAYADEPDRREAVAKWRRWLATASDQAGRRQQ